MDKVKRITLNILNRFRNRGITPTCNCGCGYEFKVGDFRVIKRTNGHGNSNTRWYRPECWEKLLN